MVLYHQAFRANLDGSDPSAAFSTLSGQAVAASGPEPDPAKLARVLEAITAHQAEAKPSDPWPFSESITTIKFVRRVFTDDPELRATLATQFLTGSDKSPGLAAERLSLFANAAAKLLESEAEPLLEPINVADETLEALWWRASAPPGTDPEVINKATEFWAALAAEYNFNAQAVPINLWEATDNLSAFVLREHCSTGRTECIYMREYYV
jgi:hypothetical protein